MLGESQQQQPARAGGGPLLLLCSTDQSRHFGECDVCRYPQPGTRHPMLLRRLARPMLSTVFVVQGIDSLLNTPRASKQCGRPSRTAEAARAWGPEYRTTPQSLRASHRSHQVVAAVCLATGRMPRVAAATLAATVIPANLGDHMFWDEADPVAKKRKRRDFATDVSPGGRIDSCLRRHRWKALAGWRGRRAGRRAIEGRWRRRCRPTKRHSSWPRRSVTNCGPARNVDRNWRARQSRGARRLRTRFAGEGRNRAQPDRPLRGLRPHLARSSRGARSHGAPAGIEPAA